jgi:ornithine decarboxylase
LISKEINNALDQYFPVDFFAQINGTADENKLKIIAEPGRYYACSAFTLCVSVIAKRVMNQTEAQQKQDKEAFSQSLDVLDTSTSMMYYINDGVYASFNCLFYDHAECLPILIQV